jgi:hypothetical protein
MTWPGASYLSIFSWHQPTEVHPIYQLYSYASTFISLGLARFYIFFIWWVITILPLPLVVTLWQVYLIFAEKSSHVSPCDIMDS